jgi:hypothetical protein
VRRFILVCMHAWIRPSQPTNKVGALSFASTLRACAVICLATQLVGCAEYINRPSVTDRIPINQGTNEYIQFLTRSDRRVLLVSVKGTGNSFVCAEPSPDVAQNVSSSLQAAISAKKAGLDPAGTLAQSITESADKLFNRSQGAQLYRDGMFYLCLAYMNGAIDQKQFATSSADLLISAEKLITAEIPRLAEASQQDQNQQSGAKKSAAAADNAKSVTLSVSRGSPAPSTKDKSSIPPEK